VKPKVKAMPQPERGLPAAKWIPVFDVAGVVPPSFVDAKTPHAKTIKVGQWLSSKVGRELPISVNGRTGKAVLRVIGARANEKRYYFEITWATAVQPQPAPPAGKVTATPKKSKKSKLKTTKQSASKPKSGANDRASGH